MSLILPIRLKLVLTSGVAALAQLNDFFAAQIGNLMWLLTLAYFQVMRLCFDISLSFL
jgi:hypothetical protein